MVRCAHGRIPARCYPCVRLSVLSRDAARVLFLELMLPQLWAGGFDRVAASYSVERDRLLAQLSPVDLALVAARRP